MGTNERDTSRDAHRVNNMLGNVLSGGTTKPTVKDAAHVSYARVGTCKGKEKVRMPFFFRIIPKRDSADNIRCFTDFTSGGTVRLRTGLTPEGLEEAAASGTQLAAFHKTKDDKTISGRVQYIGAVDGHWTFIA